MNASMVMQWLTIWTFCYWSMRKLGRLPMQRWEDRSWQRRASMPMWWQGCRLADPFLGELLTEDWLTSAAMVPHTIAVVPCSSRNGAQPTETVMDSSIDAPDSWTS